jgi:hypothetical protein
MDGGANGGIGGRDMKLMSYNTDGRRVNIGIAGDHQMTGKKLGTFCAVITTQLGRVLGIFHQYAHVPEQARSIHSRCQFQSYGNLVGDTATIYGGPQRIDTSDGYQLPLCIRSGLPYISQSYPTADDMDLPHVVFTSPAEWNPDTHDDVRSPEEMIRQFPAVPRDAANEFYDLKGNVNLEYLRSVKTAEIATESDNDDIPHDMPGLQPREPLMTQAVMMTALMRSNQSRHQRQCNGKFQLMIRMARNLPVNVFVHNVQNAMQNGWPIVRKELLKSRNGSTIHPSLRMHTNRPF